MAKQLDENSQIQISIKTLAGIAALIFTLVGMWFTLQADITEAKQLPLPPDPEVTRMEFDMKDQLIRQTIMATQEDVKEIKAQKKTKKELSILVAENLAKKAKDMKITKVYFDRGVYKYHGRVKLLADELRKNGMEF